MDTHSPMAGLNRFENVLLLVAIFGTGCPIDPKTVGEDTAADGEGDGEGDDGSASADDDGESSDDGPTVSGGSEDDASDDGEWDDCAGRACGDFCHVCDPEDPECGEPGTFTVCSPEGTCEIWENWDVDPCPGTGVEADVESTLTNVGGCYDMTVYATNEELDVALHVRVPGLASEAVASGQPIMREYVADNPEIVVELTAGSNLLAETCTDVLEDPPTLTELWRPQLGEEGGPGTVSITVEVVDDAPLADITLTDVNFHRVDYDGLDPDIQIESLVLEDVNVQLVPG